MTKGYSQSLSVKVGHRPNLSWCGVMLQGTVQPLAAANSGREAVAKRLLDHGAEVTAARHEGATTLRAAAQGDHEAVDKPYWAVVPMWPLQNARVRVRGGLLLVVAVRQWPSCSSHSSPCGADVACAAGCSSGWS